MQYIFLGLFLLFNYSLYGVTTVNVTLVEGKESVEKSFTYHDPNNPTHIIDCGKHIIEATIIEENEEGLILQFKVFDPTAGEHTKLIAETKIKTGWNEKTRLQCLGLQVQSNNFALELIATKS